MAEQKVNNTDESIMDYYTSLSPSNRMTEVAIVHKSIKNGVVPESVRYGVMNNVFRGIVKSSKDDLYYFSYIPDGKFSLVKANDRDKVWEANKLLKSCSLGCDIVRMEKADVAMGSMPVVDEEQDVVAQQRLATAKHPGAAGSVTPDLPEVGRQWHEEEEITQKADAIPGGLADGKSPSDFDQDKLDEGVKVELEHTSDRSIATEIAMDHLTEDQDYYSKLKEVEKSWNAASLIKGLGQSLQRTAPRTFHTASDKEKQFLLEVVGKTPEQIEAGDTRMNPTQKVLYARWMNKSLRSKLNDLKGWRK